MSFISKVVAIGIRVYSNCSITRGNYAGAALVWMMVGRKGMPWPLELDGAQMHFPREGVMKEMPTVLLKLIRLLLCVEENQAKSAFPMCVTTPF